MECVVSCLCYCFGNITRLCSDIVIELMCIVSLMCTNVQVFTIVYWIWMYKIVKLFNWLCITMSLELNSSRFYRSNGPGKHRPFWHTLNSNLNHLEIRICRFELHLRNSIDITYWLVSLLTKPNFIVYSVPTYLSTTVAKYCDEYVCLSVHSRMSETTLPNFTKFLVHVACNHGSVLFWQRCDTLCTSGFVDWS